MVGSWDSTIEGELQSWADWIKPGAVVERKYAGCVCLRYTKLRCADVVVKTPRSCFSLVPILSRFMGCVVYVVPTLQSE